MDRIFTVKLKDLKKPIDERDIEKLIKKASASFGSIIVEQELDYCCDVIIEGCEVIQESDNYCVIRVYDKDAGDAKLYIRDFLGYSDKNNCFVYDKDEDDAIGYYFITEDMVIKYMGDLECERD